MTRSPMTSDATSPPDPDDAKAEAGKTSSDGAKVDPGALPEAAAPVEPAATATPDKPAGEAAAPAVSPPAAPVFRPNYLFLLGIATLSLVADLATKEWAKARIKNIRSLDDQPIELLPKLFFRIVFARNEGGAWGLLREQPESIRRPFFLGISALAIVFIVSLYRRLTPEQTALKWGLPLVLGGALGNLVNRVQYNYVVDFIDIYVVSGGKEHPWPTFNVADIAICVGVGLMAIDMFTSRRPATGAAAKGDARATSKQITDADPPSKETADADPPSKETADADPPSKETADAGPAPKQTPDADLPSAATADAEAQAPSAATADADLPSKATADAEAQAPSAATADADLPSKATADAEAQAPSKEIASAEPVAALEGADKGRISGAPAPGDALEDAAADDASKPAAKAPGAT